jgi:hypothetical protein
MKKFGLIAAIAVSLVGLIFTITSILNGNYFLMAVFATMASMAIFLAIFMLMLDRQKKKGIVPKPHPAPNASLPDEMILSPGIDKVIRFMMKHVQLIFVLIPLVGTLGFLYYSVKLEVTISIICFSFLVGIGLDSIIIYFYKKLKNKQEPMADALQQ